MRKRTIAKPKAVSDHGSGSVQKEEYSVKVKLCMKFCKGEGCTTVHDYKHVARRHFLLRCMICTKLKEINFKRRNLKIFPWS